MELIMICANKQGGEKQERWKHAVWQNKTNKQNCAVGSRISSERWGHHSAVVWLPAWRNLCCLDPWCLVGCLPHLCLCKRSGSPLFLRDLQPHSRIAVWVYFHLLCGLLPVPSSVLGNHLSYFSLLFVILILFGIIIVWTLASSWVCHLISHSCQARPRLLPSSSVLSFHFAS